MTSYIIPAFNVRPYLEDCLRSLPGEGAEIIVVDDGSTDGTADLVRSGFPSVRLLSRENGGVSSARNAGMAMAEGEWLVFVDADDRILPDASEKLSLCLEKAGCDIVVMRSFCGGMERYPWKGRFREAVAYTADDVATEGYVRGSVCGCAFRKAYLEEHGISFNTDLSVAEDTVFFATALSAGGRVEFRDIPFYDIRERQDSAYRRRDAGFLSRYGLALGAAARRIGHPVLRTRTCLSLVLGITDAGIGMGWNPAAVRKQAGIDTVLPLSPEGVGKDGWAVRLLNGNYSLFYRLKQIRNRLRK